MEDYTKDNPNVEILDDNVIVFHNVLSDPDDYIDYYEEYGDWRGWYGFGRQIDSRVHTFIAHPHFPTLQEWEDVAKKAETEQGADKYFLEVAKAFHFATKFYIEHTGISLTNWSCQPWGLARYIPDENLNGNEHLTMNYHSDYMPEIADSPGDKFGITGVLYPNDDYEGGEIAYRVIEDGEVVREFEYKPKAGDLVIFPSGYPYFHAVKRIYGAPKYITRLYWMYNFEGTPDWHELKEKYGDEFEELEISRRKRHDLKIMEPYMKMRVTLKEYYQLLESGNLKDRYEPDEEI
jgi:hypothetical protein